MESIVLDEPSTPNAQHSVEGAGHDGHRVLGLFVLSYVGEHANTEDVLDIVVQETLIDQRAKLFAATILLWNTGIGWAFRPQTVGNGFKVDVVSRRQNKIF